MVLNGISVGMKNFNENLILTVTVITKRKREINIIIRDDSFRTHTVVKNSLTR